MKRQNKRGITITSIVVYVILFFLFTAVTTSISSRINKNLFDDRGRAINITAINKLEYNLLKSADESSNATVENINNVYTIIFSNGDEYEFDLQKKCILKNGGKLVRFLKEYNVTISSNHISMDITLNKYTNNVSRNIVIAVPINE